MARAFIIVDVQNDFLPKSMKSYDTTRDPHRLAPYIMDGALAVPNGDLIIPALVKEAYGGYDLVVATRDWHPATHMSFDAVGGQWPVHCVAGSEGAALHPSVDLVADVIVSKGQDPDKEEYSAFNRSLEKLLAWDRNEEICDYIEIVIGGLATDYCVFDTALDIKRRWEDVNVVVLSDATAGIWNVQSEALTAGKFAAAGIEYRGRQ